MVSSVVPTAASAVAVLPANLPNRRVDVRSLGIQLFLLAASSLSPAIIHAQDAQGKPAAITIDWNKTVVVSKSTPTLQVVTNPMLNPGSPIHDGAFTALKMLGA